MVNIVNADTHYGLQKFFIASYSQHRVGQSLFVFILLDKTPRALSYNNLRYLKPIRYSTACIKLLEYSDIAKYADHEGGESIF